MIVFYHIQRLELETYGHRVHYSILAIKYTIKQYRRQSSMISLHFQQVRSEPI